MWQGLRRVRKSAETLAVLSDEGKWGAQRNLQFPGEGSLLRERKQHRGVWAPTCETWIVRGWEALRGVRKIKYGQKASGELISSQEKENEQIVRRLSLSLSFSPSVCIHRNDGSVMWGHSEKASVFRPRNDHRKKLNLLVPRPKTCSLRTVNKFIPFI